jgi:hypothetical protein
MPQLQIRPKTATNLTTLIKSAVENQMLLIDFGIAKTKRKLKEFEKEFGMNSSTFFKKFNEGQLGDDFKYVRWAGEYETLEQLQKDYNDLKDLELCS